MSNTTHGIVRTSEQHISVIINTAIRTSPNAPPCYVDGTDHHFKNMESVKTFFYNLYGCIPSTDKKIWIDHNDEVIEVGFTHSYWGKERPHGTDDGLYYTDWIEMSRVSKTAERVFITKDFT